MMHILDRNGLNLQALGKYCIAAPVVFFIASILFSSIEYAYYRIAPISSFVEYYSVTPTISPFQAKDQLEFTSHRSIHRKVKLSWLDVLMCDINNNDRYHHYSQQSSGRYYGNPSINKKITWAYHKQKPSGSKCYLESTITANLPYNINKRVIIISPEFYIH